MVKLEKSGLSTHLVGLSAFTKRKTPEQNVAIEKQNLTYPSLENLKANFLSFRENNGLMLNAPKNDELQLYFNKNMSDLWDKSIDIAKKNNSSHLDGLHLVKALLSECQNELVNYKTTSEDYNKLNLLTKSIMIQAPDLIEDQEYKDTVKDLILRTILKIDKEIFKLKTDSPKEDSLILSDSLTKITDKLLKDSISTKFNGIDNGIISVEDLVSELLLNKNNDNSSSTILSDFFKSLQSLNKSYSTKGIISEYGITNFTKINSEKLLPIEFYENKAKTLATTLTPGKHSIVTYENGAMPELLVHNFTNALRNNKLKGFSSDTSIHLIDFNKSTASGKLIYQEIDTIVTEARKNPEKDYVIFVNDFDQYYNLMLRKAEENIRFSPITQFKANIFGPNVHIVGMMEEPMYSNLVNPPQTSLSSKRISLSVKGFEKISLSYPSEQAAIDLLKKYTQELLMASLPENVSITPEAIEQAVIKASNSRSGAMPGKAIELIKFVALSKKHNSSEKKITIKPEDLQAFSLNYPELKHSPESSTGIFSLTPDTGIRLSDVGGVSAAKEKLQELLNYLKNPDKYKKIGAKIPKGYILTGEPGNGKTYLAKAVAGEANVPFIATSGSQFVEKFVGVGASRVRDLFAFAREQASISEKKTAIIFIDELDALAKARSSDSNTSHSEAEQTLNQLLIEMDGLTNDPTLNIVVIGATNRPDILDKAVIDRPGRFDNVIEVPNPSKDIESRYEILSIHAKKVKIDGEREKILKDLAARTAGASSARLADIINKAIMIAAKDNRESISINDLIEAKLEAMAGPTSKFKATEEEKKLIISHEWGHAGVNAVMYDIIKNGSKIDLVTLDSRGGGLAAVWFIPGDNIEATTETVFADIAKSLGGDAAERVLFKHSGSSGISGDISSATNTALTAIEHWGIGANTGKISINNAQMRELFKEEIKQDLKSLTSAASNASERIVNFLEPFIRQQAEEYYPKVGKGGNNLLGDEFRTNLFNWINKTDRTEAYESLKQDILRIMSSIKSPQYNNDFKRAAFK